MNKVYVIVEYLKENLEGVLEVWVDEKDALNSLRLYETTNAYTNCTYKIEEHWLQDFKPLDTGN